MLIRRAGLWLAGVLVLAGVLAGLTASQHLTIQSDLLALLPAPQRDALKTAALQRIANLGERRVTLLIGGAESDARQRAAQAAASRLATSTQFEDVATRAADLLDADQRQSQSALYFRHRFQLLAPADRAALQDFLAQQDSGATLDRFTQRALSQLYGLGQGYSSRFISDPYGLAGAYRDTVTARPALPGIRVAANGQLYAEDQNANGQRYAAVFAQTRHDPFTLSAQADQSRALQDALDAARQASPQAEILVSGVLRHAVAATRTARREVSLIGFGSLAGILLLMIWAFASIRPFLLSVAAVGGGCLLAVVATASLFGGLHLLTVVFGASLVGVAIDYCFHFFAQRWDTPAPRAALTRIFPAITLGLITSVLAYGGMAIAPFPALRQMAVFAAFGLIGAWLGVVLLLPALAGPAPRRAAVQQWAQRWLRHGPARLAANHISWWIGGLTALFAVCTASALLWLQPDDDIRLLYNPAPELAHDEQRVAALLGTRSAGQAIVVRGASTQALLEAEAELVQALTASAEPAAEFTALTRAYPPSARQRANYQLLQKTLYQPGGAVDSLLADVGFSADAIRQHRQDFEQAQTRVLDFAQWQASPAGTALAPLWLGQVEGDWASLILLHEIHDPSRLARILAAHPQAQLVDRVADISALLADYRGLATRLLAGAYVVAWLILGLAFGARGAFVVLLPPLLASAATALIFALCGWPFSLFNLMAMVLLLGMGADYGIFLRMAGRQQQLAMAAVGLSAATTLLAFGLLALSITPALHSFGLTLALGLTITFLVASLIGPRADDSHTNSHTNSRKNCRKNSKGLPIRGGAQAPEENGSGNH